jgi:hypothetical protein
MRSLYSADRVIPLLLRRAADLLAWLVAELASGVGEGRVFFFVNKKEAKKTLLI